MARQGLLAQSTPAATTDTLLYSASVTESASAMLKIANDGTGAAYRVALSEIMTKKLYSTHQHINSIKVMLSLVIEFKLTPQSQKQHSYWHSIYQF